jgi:diacylglycerol kinase (ATP)
LLWFHPWQRPNCCQKSFALRLCFIVNLRSGAARRALPFVEAFARRHDAAIHRTQHARHACTLAGQAVADGCTTIVAVGGDGTMNEVASALLDTSATLGLVPCGSGDGLGRHLHIHGSPARALAILETGHVRTIDSGAVNGHTFFCAAGIGFEAEIAHRFNRLQRRGFLRYLTTSASGYFAY